MFDETWLIPWSSSDRNAVICSRISMNNHRTVVVAMTQANIKMAVHARNNEPHARLLASLVRGLFAAPATQYSWSSVDSDNNWSCELIPPPAWPLFDATHERFVTEFATRASSSLRFFIFLPVRSGTLTWPVDSIFCFHTKFFISVMFTHSFVGRNDANPIVHCWIQWMSLEGRL